MSGIVKVLFTLSILINIALIGGVSGHFYRQIQDSSWPEISGDVAPETRALMRQVYKEKHKMIWDLRSQMQDRKNDLKKTIVAESFDLKAFETSAAALKRQNEISFNSRVESFGSILAQLPKSEREKLAQRTVDLLVGHRKWDHTKGKPHPELIEGKNPFAQHGPDDDAKQDMPEGKKQPKNNDD